MASRYVLDASAILALLADEPGADRVAQILDDTQALASVSTINLGEVYYIVLRRR